MSKTVTSATVSEEYRHVRLSDIDVDEAITVRHRVFAYVTANSFVPENEDPDAYYGRLSAALEAKYGLTGTDFLLAECTAQDCPSFIRRHRVSMYPTLLIFEDGRLIAKSEGFSASTLVSRSGGGRSAASSFIDQAYALRGVSGERGSLAAGEGSVHNSSASNLLHLSNEGGADNSGGAGGGGGVGGFGERDHLDDRDHDLMAGRMLGNLFDSRVRQLAVPFDRTLRRSNLINFALAIGGILIAVLVLELGHSGRLERGGWELNILRIICSASTILLIGRLYQYRIMLLRIDQYRWNLVQRRSLLGWDGLLLALEFLICVWHPFPFLTFNEVAPTEERLDERIPTIMFLRIYLVFRVIRDHSSVYTMRKEIIKSSESLTRESVSASDFNWFFAIKTLFHFNNVAFVLILLAIGPLLFAYCILVSEREFQPAFAEYKHPLWYTLVTMLTIGYGDYSTDSMWGRTYSILSGFYGVIITALVITVVSDSLAMSNGEKYAATIARLRKIEAAERNAAVSYIQLMWRRHALIKARSLDAVRHLRAMGKRVLFDGGSGSGGGGGGGGGGSSGNTSASVGSSISGSTTAGGSHHGSGGNIRGIPPPALVRRAPPMTASERTREEQEHLSHKVAIMKRLKSLRRDRLHLSEQSEYAEPVISRLELIMSRVETMSTIVLGDVKQRRAKAKYRALAAAGNDGSSDAGGGAGLSRFSNSRPPSRNTIAAPEAIQRMKNTVIPEAPADEVVGGSPSNQQGSKQPQQSPQHHPQRPPFARMSTNEHLGTDSDFGARPMARVMSDDDIHLDRSSPPGFIARASSLTRGGKDEIQQLLDDDTASLELELEQAAIEDAKTSSGSAGGATAGNSNQSPHQQPNQNQNQNQQTPPLTQVVLPPRQQQPPRGGTTTGGGGGTTTASASTSSKVGTYRQGTSVSTASSSHTHSQQNQSQRTGVRTLTLAEAWIAVRALGGGWEMVLGGSNVPVIRGSLPVGAQDPITVAGRVANVVQLGGAGTKVGVDADAHRVIIAYAPQRTEGITANDFAVLEQVQAITQRR